MKKLNITVPSPKLLMSIYCYVMEILYLYYFRYGVPTRIRFPKEVDNTMNKHLKVFLLAAIPFGVIMVLIFGTMQGIFSGILLGAMATIVL